VKALAQLKGESDENEKIPETENSEKTAFSKTRQINAAMQHAAAQHLFLRCGTVRPGASKCPYEVEKQFKNNELARSPPT
jgi:uncharacterized protein (DUF1501 family)